MTRARVLGAIQTSLGPAGSACASSGSVMEMGAWSRCSVGGVPSVLIPSGCVPLCVLLRVLSACWRAVSTCCGDADLSQLARESNSATAPRWVQTAAVPTPIWAWDRWSWEMASEATYIGKEEIARGITRERGAESKRHFLSIHGLREGAWNWNSCRLTAGSQPHTCSPPSAKHSSPCSSGAT